MSPFETISPNAFVQHLAIRLVGNGYVYCVAGEIPSHKDPEQVDWKFVKRYDVGLSKWAMLRNFDRGEAKVRYIRHGRIFALTATAGVHSFLEEERAVIKDLRSEPVCFFGYLIRCREKSGTFHPMVRMGFGKLFEFRTSLMAAALGSDEDVLERIRNERLLCFSDVKRQVFQTLQELNGIRSQAGLEPVFLPSEMVANHSLKVFRE